MLPEDFIRQMTTLLGTERWEHMRQALDEEAPVSIRLNGMKSKGLQVACADGQVPWCTDGWYLAVVRTVPTRE